jgi:hypothetical protein
MDKFDQETQMHRNAGPEDRKSMVSRYSDMCRCPVCPSFTECAKNDNEGIFCLQGNSFRCINQIRGCNCPTCDVKQNLSMQDMMYCMKGSEFENRYLGNMK